jgi:hypothetical protein
MSQSGGLDHVAHSIMNADETNSVSLLIDDETYSVTPYVMTRLTMGTCLSKIPPRPCSDWPHEDYFVCGPLERDQLIPGQNIHISHHPVWSLDDSEIKSEHEQLPSLGLVSRSSALSKN